MKIAIDARLYGLQHAGIGRYVQSLITELSKLDTKNHYTIIASDPDQIKPTPKHSQIIHSNIRHYSLAEQTTFLSQINSLQVDLFHFPHFNTPLMYNKPYVITIHDLLWNEKIGFNTTTLNPLLYSLKYFGYRATIKNAIKKSKRIITPTNHVAQAIIQKFNQPQDKLIVTHEAADPIFFTKSKSDSSLLKKRGLKKPFVIHTGSLYPHKNVNKLIEAISQTDNIQLALIFARDIFVDRAKKTASDLNITSRIKFLGRLSDKDVLDLYSHALALVLPSQSEGFGLTGLEAMAAGLPVISSDHSVMKEVYSQSAIYTDTSNAQNIASAIEKLQKDPKRVKQLSNSGIKQARKYSWKKLARQTLQVYNQALNQDLS